MHLNPAVAHLQRSHLPVLQEHVVMNVSRLTDNVDAIQQESILAPHEMSNPRVLGQADSNLLGIPAKYNLLDSMFAWYAAEVLPY